MADRIGSVECFDWSGAVPAQAQDALAFEYLPDGLELWLTGRHYGPFAILARFVNVSLDEYESAFETLCSYSGAGPTTFGKADGRSWSDCFIGSPEPGGGVRLRELAHVQDGAGNDVVNAVVEVVGHRGPN